MHISLKTQTAAGLRIIGEIPAIPVCRLEGYNAIGKSSALALLQLCVGQQPFTDDQLWRSFRDNLLSAEVEVSGLENGTSISWNLTPRHWSEHIETPSDGWIGEIRVDGEPSDLSLVRSLLSVHRIDGSQQLPHTLAEDLRRHAQRLRVWEDPNGIVQQRRARLDELFSTTLGAFGPTSIEESYANIVSALTEAENHLHEARSEREAANAALRALDEAASLRDRVARVVEGEGPLEAELRSIDQEIAQRQGEQTALHSQIDKLTAEMADNAVQLRRFRRLEASEAKLANQVEEHLRMIEATASKIEVASGVSSAELLVLTTEKRGELEALLAQRPEVHVAPLMLEVIHDVESRVDRAIAEGLGDQIIIGDEEATNPVLTVADLKAALGARVTVLNARPVDERASLLDAAIAEIEQLLGTAEELASRQLLLAKSRSAHQKAVDGVKEAATSLGSTNPGRLELLLTSQDELRQTLFDLGARRARVNEARMELLGGHSLTDLTTRLAEQVVAVGVTDAELDGALASAHEHFGARAANVENAQGDVVAARTGVSEMAKAIDDAVDALRHGLEWEWLRPSMADQLGLAPPYDVQARLLDGLRGALNDARAKLDEVVKPTALLGSMNTLARHITGDSVNLGEYGDPVRHWYEGVVTTLFKEPDLHALVFGGVQGLRVDLLTREVKWQGADGVEARPLSAFSSGERSFAYTRARLASIDRETPRAANRLIALDEYGAFISWNGLERLGRYLTTREGDHGSDQILVILPLSFDPEAESVPASRKESLSVQGYFAEAFSS